MSEAAEAIADEAEREGLTLDRLSRKIRRAATHVRDAMVDAVADATVKD
jgi:hypothetical protein